MGQKKREFESFEWFDFENPSEEELLELTLPFRIDINLLEDSLQHGHLPKLEKIPDYTFILLRAYSAGHEDVATSVTELSNKIAFFVNDRRLITIHRTPFAFLDKFTDKYTDSESLMLDIFNEMLETFEGPLNWQSEMIDDIERDIFLKSGDRISLETLYFQKSKARISRKLLFLTQGVLNQFHVKDNLTSNLQDLKETVVNQILQYEEITEDANTLMNTYMSQTAQKSNDVMKLLTIFSAFFLPLTFIAGLYGMNFHNMPELKLEYGYFFTLGAMAIISMVIFFWFRRRKII